MNNWRDTSCKKNVPMSVDPNKPGGVSATVAVPPGTICLNFVVHDGAGGFDNNHGRDYKVNTSEAYAAELTPGNETLRNDLMSTLVEEWIEARKVQRAEDKRRGEERVRRRAATRARAIEVIRRQQAHVLYSEPAEPVAGQSLVLNYNPDNTNLKGASSIYVRGGYNNWTHRATFGPIQMQRQAGAHFTAKVDLPSDAYRLDFVFSDVAEGDGQYDNRGGLDWHIDVTGATTSAKPLHVVHVAVEMAPICKVGGLGDVVTSLGRAVQDLGHRVEVVVPKYDVLKYECIEDMVEVD